MRARPLVRLTAIHRLHDNALADEEVMWIVEPLRTNSMLTKLVYVFRGMTLAFAARPVSLTYLLFALLMVPVFVAMVWRIRQ